MTRTINTLWGLLAAALAIRLGLSALLPLADTTEPRYAEIARIMAETGDWITPWFDHGVPFWGKPPLSFWAQALSFKLFGVSEFAGRLPSWLANVLTVALVFAMRFHLHANTDRQQATVSGLWAALIYATTALGFLSGGTIMTDSYLALGTTLTLASLLIRLRGGSDWWGWGFFIGLGIGLLAKGPLVLVLTGVPVFCWAVITRQWRNLWRCLPWLSGTALTLLLVLPWYLLAELKTPGFLDYFIVGEHFKRFIISGWQGDLYGNAHEFTRGTIWLYLAVASFPWGLIAVTGWGIRRWRSTPVPARAASDGTTMLLTVSALTPAIFFTFSGNILWTYTLPSLPFIAVLAAGVISQAAGYRWQRASYACALLIPLAASSGAGWLAIHPEQLKTERDLVARASALPELSPDQLHYLGEAPFSARFYSQGLVQSLSPDELQNRLADAQLPPPALVAVSNNDKAWLDRLRKTATVLDQNRRYTLFRLSDGKPAAITAKSITIGSAVTISRPGATTGATSDGT